MNERTLVELGVVAVAGQRIRGLWTVTVIDDVGLEGVGHSVMSCAEALDTATRLLRWAQVGAGSRPPRSVEQVRQDREE